VNAANKGGRGGSGGCVFRSRGRGNRRRGGQAPHRGLGGQQRQQFNQQRFNSGNVVNTNSTDDRPLCQVCYKKGHNASVC
jgi:hypothetical protein